MLVRHNRFWKPGRGQNGCQIRSNLSGTLPLTALAVRMVVLPESTLQCALHHPTRLGSVPGNDLVFGNSHLFHWTYWIIKGLPLFLGGQEAKPVRMGWLQCLLRQHAPKSYAKSGDMRIFLLMQLDFYCISLCEMI
jgi:hypothetical protein